MKTWGWSVLSAGLALAIAFAAVRFEAGIITDEEGGTGSLPFAQGAVGLAGALAVIVGVLLLFLSARRSAASESAS